MNKAALRRELLLRRDELEPAWRAEASERIAQRVLALPRIANAARIALYAACDSEVATWTIIAKLLAQAKQVALPRILDWQGGMEFRTIADLNHDCIPGPKGIAEPDPARCPEVIPFAAFDLWFVPLVSFDAAGHRLGYGGGYYDRALADVPTERIIGLAFAAQRVMALPREAWDRPLGAICTESETFVAATEPGRH